MTVCELALPFLTLLPVLMAAQSEGDVCYFEVAVTSAKGAPVIGASVSGVHQQSGRTFNQTFTDKQGVARICDAPEGLVDILVGGNLCGAVAVRYLKPYWMRTRRISVSYENCSGDEWVLPGGCLLTLRIEDQKGTPLSGVLFDSEDKRSKLREQTQLSDQFGRIFRFVNYGESLSGRLVKQGFDSRSVTDQCKSGKNPEREQRIIMGPSPGRER